MAIHSLVASLKESKTLDPTFPTMQSQQSLPSDPPCLLKAPFFQKSKPSVCDAGFLINQKSLKPKPGKILMIVKDGFTFT